MELLLGDLRLLDFLGLRSTLSAMRVSRMWLHAALVRLTEHPLRVGADTQEVALDERALRTFRALRLMLARAAPLWHMCGKPTMPWGCHAYMQLPAGKVRCFNHESPSSYPYLVVREAHVRIVGTPPTGDGDRWPTKITGAISCQSAQNFTLECVSLTNDRRSGRVGVYFYNSRNFLVKNVEINGCAGTGISVHGGDGKVESCRVHHNDEHGMFVVGESHVKIVSTDLSYNKGCGMLCFSHVSMNCAGSDVAKNGGYGLHAAGKGTKISIVGGKKYALSHGNATAASSLVAERRLRDAFTAGGAMIVEDGYSAC